MSSMGFTSSSEPSLQPIMCVQERPAGAGHVSGVRNTILCSSAFTERTGVPLADTQEPPAPEDTPVSWPRAARGLGTQAGREEGLLSTPWPGLGALISEAAPCLSPLS